MAIDSIMDVPNCREKRPKAVDLGIISVDFRSYQEYRRYSKGKCYGSKERIGIKIELFESCRVGDGVQENLGHCTQLVEVRRDCAEVICAFW